MRALQASKVLMIVGTVALFVLGHGQDTPKGALLQPGESVRMYERTMSRRGIYERVLVLTPKKAFVRDGDVRFAVSLSLPQQNRLTSLLAKEPKGLRAHRRENPMWPSAYDASDIWITYRVGRQIKSWGNNEYEYPTSDCPLIGFLEEVRGQIASSPSGGAPNPTSRYP